MAGSPRQALSLRTKGCDILNEYRFGIITANSHYTGVADEEIVNAAMKEWKEWCESVASKSNDLLTIHCVSDEAARCDRTIVVKMEAIEAIEKTKQ